MTSINPNAATLVHSVQPASVGKAETGATLRNRRQGSSDSSSASSDDEITYEPIKASTATEARMTTRQKVDRRPPSTFHLKPWREMAWHEKLCNLAVVPEELSFVKPLDLDRGPIPYRSPLLDNLFIAKWALPPLAIQGMAYFIWPNQPWPVYASYAFYWVAFQVLAFGTLHNINKISVKYGTFDEKNIGRDATPDYATKQLATGILIYMFVRTAFVFLIKDDVHTNPLLNWTWTFPVRLGLWQITLDYFFYVYHRSCHEIDWLWNIHQHHHTTKHPTAILAMEMSEKQEVLEIFLIPLFASLIVPMTFSERWLTVCYTLMIEMSGHSGARLYWPHPILWVLKPLGMSLHMEHHDLHHRNGKSGRSYGKQSLVWDRLFGTVGEVIETKGM